MPLAIRIDTVNYHIYPATPKSAVKLHSQRQYCFIDSHDVTLHAFIVSRDFLTSKLQKQALLEL